MHCITTLLSKTKIDKKTMRSIERYLGRPLIIGVKGISKKSNRFKDYKTRFPPSTN